MINELELPYLDRVDDSIDFTLLSNDQKEFRELGFKIIKGFIPNNLIDEALTEIKTGKVKGPHDYQFSNDLKSLILYQPLYQEVSEYIGDEVGVHECDIGAHSEQTLWHQDEHYNPKGLASWGMGVFICLEDMTSSQSTVEFAVSSHRFGPQKIIETGKDHLSPQELDKKFQKTLKDTHLTTEEFLGKKGDVLLMHRDLFHRRVEKIKEPLRLLCQYSALSMRKDLDRYEYLTGGWYYIHH